MNSSEIVSQIFALYAERGHQTYGEDVTESQHALQCATFARQNGEIPAIVAACLLHDYGHLVHDLGENIADQGVATCDASRRTATQRYSDQKFALRSKFPVCAEFR